MYLRTLDDVTRTVILDLTAVDDEDDARTLLRIRVLQMIRRHLTTLATPPDVNDTDNDTPTVSL